jgi:hypothetical protein
MKTGIHLEICDGIKGGQRAFILPTEELAKTEDPEQPLYCTTWISPSHCGSPFLGASTLAQTGSKINMLGHWKCSRS